LIERAGSDFALTDEGRRVLEALMMKAATRACAKSVLSPLVIAEAGNIRGRTGQISDGIPHY
jgi:hypothetical protein